MHLRRDYCGGGVVGGGVAGGAGVAGGFVLMSIFVSPEFGARPAKRYHATTASRTSTTIAQTQLELLLL